jgi:hypothetical protein
VCRCDDQISPQSGELSDKKNEDVNITGSRIPNKQQQQANQQQHQQAASVQPPPKNMRSILQD